MLANYLKDSMESIDHQYDGLLMKDLTVLYQTIIEAPDANLGKVLEVTTPKIDKVIFDRTGIKVRVKVIDHPTPNAMVRVPQIDRNHPLLTDYHREVYRADGIRRVKDKKTIINGKVDRKRGRVSGVFSELTIPLFVTKMAVRSGLLNADEVAAITLHELGHPFTYFEYLGTGLTTNYVLQHVSRSLMETREVKRRYEIVKEGCEVLEINLDDPDALTASNNEVVVQTVMLRKVAEKRMSELNSHTYDLTAWEMLADQFVSRHGGGRSLVTAMDKLNRYGYSDSLMTRWEYHLTEAMKLLLTILGSFIVFAPAVIFYLMAFTNTNESLYDKDKARLERLRRDMVSALKDRTLDKATVNNITEDIEVVDKILEEMEDRRTYLQFFWSTFRKKGRSNYQQMKFQQELEVLVNNDIFTRAAKLRTIKL